MAGFVFFMVCATAGVLFAIMQAAVWWDEAEHFSGKAFALLVGAGALVLYGWMARGEWLQVGCDTIEIPSTCCVDQVCEDCGWYGEQCCTCFETAPCMREACVVPRH